MAPFASTQNNYKFVHSDGQLFDTDHGQTHSYMHATVLSIQITVAFSLHAVSSQEDESEAKTEEPTSAENTIFIC